MQTWPSISLILALLFQVAVPCQSIEHIEFDLTYQLPQPSAFTVSCGVLHQPAGQCQLSFSGSSNWINPNIPIVAEARFVVNQVATPQAASGALGVFPVKPSPFGGFDHGDIKIMVNPYDGSVSLFGLTTSLPPGTCFSWHTYRLEVVPNPQFTWIMRLLVDGQVAINWVSISYFGGLAPYPYNGWQLGNLNYTNCATARIDWDYVTITQTATVGAGMANAWNAALFVDSGGQYAEWSTRNPRPILYHARSGNIRHD